MTRYRDLLLGVAVAGAVALPSAGFGGGAPTQGTEGSVMTPAMAMVQTDGGDGQPVAVDIVYRAMPAGGGPGPVLAVYAHVPGATGTTFERVLLGHVASFAPPGEDGLNTGTVQVPPDLAPAFAAGDLLIELEPIAAGATPLETMTTVTLESAKVVRIR